MSHLLEVYKVARQREQGRTFSNIFELFVATQLECTVCRNQKGVVDCEHSLRLGLADLNLEGAVDIASYLDFFEHPKEDDVLRKCATCGRATQHLISTLVISEPKILIIHLDRFAQDSQTKVHRYVNCPLEGLSLGSWRPFAGRFTRLTTNYDLIATVQHMGLTGLSGHYVAHVKRRASNGVLSWMKCDDTTVVEQLQTENVVDFQTSTLVYQRREGSTTTARQG